jgi:hypothetical protein
VADAVLGDRLAALINEHPQSIAVFIVPAFFDSAVGNTKVLELANNPIVSGDN